jgi:membrane protease YdiL (CAAX protease family)
MTTVPAADGFPAPPEHPERPQASGAGDAKFPPWPGWTAPAALFTGFAITLVVALVIAGVGSIFGARTGSGDGNTSASVSILSVVVQDVCLILAALIFARMSGFPRPAQFGLNRPQVWLKACAGIVVGSYLVFVLVSYAWLQLIGQSDAKDTITESLGAKDSTVALVFVTFVVTVCAPLAEEFLFRGYFFGALRRNGFWFAAGFTGLAFGIVHVFGSPFAFIVPLIALGAGLCFIREKTGSLLPGIALHCLNNSAAMGSSEHWSFVGGVAVFVGAATAITLLVWLALRLWPEPRTAAPPVLPTTAVAPSS